MGCFKEKLKKSFDLTNKTVGACIHGCNWWWLARSELKISILLVKKGETVERNRAKKREQGIDTEGRGSGWKGESEREGSARELWWKDLCYHSWADWQNHSGYLVILARRMSITSGCFQCVVVCVCVCRCVCPCVCFCVCAVVGVILFF